MMFYLEGLPDLALTAGGLGLVIAWQEVPLAIPNLLARRGQF